MRSTTNTAEVIALTFTTWWALRVLVPDQSFAAVPQAYHHMAELAPEWAWGLGVLAICLVHFIGFVLDHMTIRRAAIFATACFWGFLASAFLIGAPHGIVWGSNAITAAVAAWAFAVTYEHEVER